MTSVASFSARRVLLLVSLVLFCTARLCKEEDYLATYTECNNVGLRDYLYYKKSDANCDDNEAVKKNKFGLKCDVLCEKGTYLVPGTEECENCIEGTYSLGGGYRVDNWETFPTPSETPFLFDTYSINSGVKGYKIWRPVTVQPNVISSGIIESKESSVMELNVLIVTEGSVSFQYQVFSSGKTGTFFFSVDEATKIEVSGATVYTEYTQILSRGYHRLIWTYAKNTFDTAVDDYVLIRDFQVLGIEYSSPSCLFCPPGSDSTAKASTCTQCEMNYFSAGNGMKCEPCEVDYYAFPGSDKCTKTIPCTANDYLEIFGECEKNNGELERSVTYAWNLPKVCDDSLMNLPSDKMVSCAACPDGQYRNPETALCTKCPSGNVLKNNECVPCEAGTAAVPLVDIKSFSSFDDYPFMTTSCEKDCVTNGFVIENGVLSSGSNNPSNSITNLYFDLDFTTAGYFYFSLKLTWFCDFYVKIDDKQVEKTFYDKNFNLSMNKGHHTVMLSYDKIDKKCLARITSLKIFGVSYDIGTAIACETCTFGSASQTGSEICDLCPPGSYTSHVKSAECTPCPINTFTRFYGSVECLPCGEGTHTDAPGASECIHNCGLVLGDTQYDISALNSPDGMIGPIADEQNMKYYLNVCSINTSNSACFDESYEPINSYACQITTICDQREKCVGTNLGDVINFSPLTSSTTEGLLLQYTHGTTGCDGVSRTLRVHIRCSPNAGVGSPHAPEGQTIEDPNHKCTYDVVWDSLYGCPVCSPKHYAFSYSPCVNGKRTKYAYWLTSPKECHGGVDLPTEELVEGDEAFCGKEGFICEPGMFVDINTKKCVECPAGTYSKGAAVYYKNLSSLPIEFSTGCSGSNCSPFSVDHKVIVSGNKDSTLELVSSIYFDSTISFKYYLIVPGDGLSRFDFKIDGKVVHTDILFTTDEEIEVSFDIKAGQHVFKWEFFNGVTDLTNIKHALMTLKSITIGGADYSSLACDPCAPGTFSSSKASKCERCPANTYSSYGSTECAICPEKTYAYPGSSFCSNSDFCTIADYSQFASECVNGKRTLSWKLNEPHFCVVDTKQLGNQIKDVVENCKCTDPFFLQDKCVTCGLGTYYKDGECENVPNSGLVGAPSLLFIADESHNPNFPPSMTTACVGECIDSGMIMSTSGVMLGHTASSSRIQKTLTFAVDENLLQIGAWMTFQAYNIISPTSAFSVYLDGIRASASLISPNTYSIDLPINTKKIVFTYTHNGESHDALGRRDFSEFLLNNIRIHRVSSEFVEGKYSEYFFSQITKCAAGTIPVSAIECAECPAGTYEVEGNCNNCKDGSVNPFKGQTKCFECPQGETDESKTSCVTKCRFDVENSASSARSVENASEFGPLLVSQNQVLYLSLCSKKFEIDALCNNIDSHVCLIQNTNTAIDFGSLLRVESNSNSDFVLTYETLPNQSDSTCPNGRKTHVHAMCANSKSDLPYILFSADCEIYIQWNSLYGCRICEIDDYEVIDGECSGGEKKFESRRKEDAFCNDLGYSNSGTESCSAVSISIILIIVAVCLFVVVVALIGVFLYLHYNVKRKYNRLIEEHPDEFDANDE